eukprot:TRINITY_DN105_c0_g1_i1.p1 TRINITY_DN105_c0_g1~~TRINITY_DN105_c0_g1_i1.p1  ORF type:complete len:222 (+),score=11.92 TRINITY_DN105_c0_g1_i1:176-841(+)
MKAAQHRATWKPNESSTTCQECHVKFSFFKRKHHCRLCGGLYCASCSGQTAILPFFGYDDPVRICEVCFDVASAALIVNNVIHFADSASSGPIRKTSMEQLENWAVTCGIIITRLRPEALDSLISLSASTIPYASPVALHVIALLCQDSRYIPFVADKALQMLLAVTRANVRETQLPALTALTALCKEEVIAGLLNQMGARSEETRLNSSHIPLSRMPSSA